MPRRDEFPLLLCGYLELLLWLVMLFAPGFLQALSVARKLRNSDPDIPSGPGQVDARLSKAPLDLEIQVASKGTWTIAHLKAPDD